MDTVSKKQNNTHTASFYIYGLDCADCAASIERCIQALQGVEGATLDFLASRLIVKHNGMPNLQERLQKVAREIESGVEILQEKKQEATKKVWTESFISVLQYIGAVLFVVGLFLGRYPTAEVVVFTIAFLCIGWRVLFTAVGNLVKGRVFDENFLMSIATIGAFVVGEYAEGVAVMLFYQVGEGFQERAVEHSKKSISSLMEIRSDYANVLVNGQEQKLAPEAVAVGDIIIVRAGERVPLDGNILEGSSSLDMVALTGESLPRDVDKGSEVLSGSVNLSGLLKIQVTAPFGQSTVSKILELVQNSGQHKAVSEKFITKFAKYYTPFVVVGAILVAIIPPLVTSADFGVWFRRALVFLVISCPCALVLSVPLSYFGGIGGAAKNGILIKGANYLDALVEADTIILDKTGTLTKGVFVLKEITPLPPFTKEELLYYSRIAESGSLHPIAVCIRDACDKEINTSTMEQYEELAGFGVSATIDGKKVLVGNGKLMATNNIDSAEVASQNTIAHIAIDNRYAGYLLIGDELKDNAPSALDAIRAQGINNIVMLTGDSRKVAADIASQLGNLEYQAELLPYQKISALQEIEQRAKGKTIFVGDGINDAPVLMQSDIGIAMGVMGADAALEAADIVLMTDDLSKISTTLKIAKRTKRIVTQNIAFSLAVKGTILALGAMGLVNMWGAVFADVGVSLIAVLNALRAMRIRG